MSQKPTRSAADNHEQASDAANGPTQIPPQGTTPVLSDPLNDPKYAFRDNRVWNRADGQPIPDDEPVMLFRARDKRALPMIEYYAALVASGDPNHVEAVHIRHEDFTAFARAHPDRMKEPDTAPLPKPPLTGGV